MHQGERRRLICTGLVYSLCAGTYSSSRPRISAFSLRRRLGETPWVKDDSIQGLGFVNVPLMVDLGWNTRLDCLTDCEDDQIGLQQDGNAVGRGDGQLKTPSASLL